MGNNIANSKILDCIFERAEKLKSKSGNKILTINHIFAAVLEHVSETMGLKETADFGDEIENNALFMMIGNVVLCDNISDLVELLCSKKDSYVDDLMFRQVVSSSKQSAEKKGRETVTADIFLECIMNVPTDEIKTIMEKAKTKEIPNLSDEKKSPFAKAFREHMENCTEDISANTDSGEIVEQDSNSLQPKEKIAHLIEKIKNMQKEMSSVILGQDKAINDFASGYFQAELTNIINKNKKPMAAFLFVGPSGVGKAFFAEQGAKALGYPIKKIDMSEYSDKDSMFDLLGIKGNSKDGLINFVEQNPRCVLLFDGIENAHVVVTHVLLQAIDGGLFDDGKLGDNLDFSQTIMIFTTNAGKKVYEGSLTTNLSGISKKTIWKVLETEINPRTEMPIFPMGLCSKFAMDNLIVFNYMEADSLRKMVEREFTQCATSFERETGIKFEVSDDVYSCILFSEGGRADSETLKKRANNFFKAETYELFRLLSNENNNTSISNVEKISVTLELPENEHVRNLFIDNSKGHILSFGDMDLCSQLNKAAEKRGCFNIIASSAKEAEKIINKQDIDLVFCDLHSGKVSDKSNELNIEDVDSQGRTFFKYVCESTDVPLYILSDKNHKYKDEEVFSLIEEGARGVVDVSLTDNLDADVSNILTQLHLQKTMIELSRSSKVVTYETSQTVSSEGKIAEIKLFDIDLETVVDDEDKDNILSDISKPKVRFDDIIGAESAKDELKYFVDYLKNPKQFSSKGLGVPKGVLFYGPPGTGKTMLAKAVAGESDVTFISAEGNQFRKKYVGEGEDEVHKLFATARKYAPTIIFIDEIDAIAKERTGESDSSDSILTAFLAEMDGFKTDAKKPIFVMGATNFEVESGTKKSLDAALLRRFDRHIYIGLPDKEARIKYMNERIKDKPIFNISNEEIENIAVRSTGMSLANLASVFEFSMRIAIRENKNVVDDAILEEAFETFNYGDEKKWDESELRKTAYHEAGHAFLCWHSGETPSYLTIVARGNHGGYMLHGDTEKIGSYTKAMLLNRIRTSLGGRASELVFFGDEDGLTTGAGGDLRTATSIAKNIVCNYGMDENVGLAVVQESELSDGVMAQQVRNSVNNILRNELESAKNILKENQIAIEKIVEELLQKNHLSSNEIDKIFSTYAEKRLTNKKYYFCEKYRI